MKRFYSQNIIGNTALLHGSERDHCVKVLRTLAGELVEIVDGKGGIAEGRLVRSDKREAVIELTGPLQHPEEMHFPVIAMSLPKSPSRWEFFLEKATEIGISRIIPLVCQRSERTKFRLERSEQVILAAFKQSLHLHLPILTEVIRLEAFLAQKQYAGPSAYIACCPPGGMKHENQQTDQNPYLGVLHQKPAGLGTSIVLIGPEGDFTPEEISLAIGAGYSPVSLGPGRLRVETAGMAACNIIQCIEHFS